MTFPGVRSMQVEGQACSGARTRAQVRAHYVRDTLRPTLPSQHNAHAQQYICVKPGAEGEEGIRLTTHPSSPSK